MKKSTRGKFIVIEGTDGSGKTTQFSLLQRRLKNAGTRLLIADFPRYYESIWGKMVGEFLTGKYGRFDEVHPKLVVLPYMMDQYTWSRDVGKPWLKRGGVILSNRYFTSNVHQIAKLRTKAQKNYRDWLWSTGYDELKLLKPDLVIFIDVPPKIAKNLNRKKYIRGYLKGKKQDLAEKNWEHQEASYREYLYTVKHDRTWVAIKCITGRYIDTPIEIHERVWKEVSKIL